MLSDIASLVEKMIPIKSVPGNSFALDEILTLVLSQLESYTIERFEHKGVRSALVYNEKVRPDRFKVVLNAHLDIIPAKEEQYTPYTDGDRLYGAGSLDMKGSVACLVWVFKEVVSKIDYPLGLQLVTDEEVGGFNGTKFQVDQGINADFVLAAEPTNLDVVHKTKGVLWARLVSSGSTAHGAYPWRGKNAIWEMQNFLVDLEKKYPVPAQEEWKTTVNVSSIRTANEVFNKVPDSCDLRLDIRFVPEDTDDVMEYLKTVSSNLGLELEILANDPAQFIDPENKYIALIRKFGERSLGREIKLRGAHGSSDARHFVQMGTPGIEFGPVGSGIGGDNEWVDIPSLKHFSIALRDFLLALT